MVVRVVKLMISLLAHSSELAVLLWRQHHSVGENVIVPRNGERVGKAKVVDRHRRGLQGPYLRSSAVCEAVKINDDVWLFKLLTIWATTRGGKTAAFSLQHGNIFTMKMSVPSMSVLGQV